VLKIRLPKNAFRSPQKELFLGRIAGVRAVDALRSEIETRAKKSNRASIVRDVPLFNF